MSTQSTERYDAIVIGAGQAGKPLSLDLAKAGRKTALVEREYVGGTCVNVGCTPTKTMVASARVAHLARRAADYGVHTGPVTVDVLVDAEALRVRRADGGLELDVRTPEGERTLGGTHLLVAAGRAPNTEDLDLEAAGVATDEQGFVVVDEKLATSVEGIYALGDVKGGPQFTHISYDDYRIVEKNLLDGGAATTEDRLVPYTVFIHPQLGRVGITEEEASSRGLRVRVAKLPMAHVARAIEVDETRGFVKAIVDAETERILGCAALGVEGGEIMSMIEIAMMGNVPYTALRDGVFAHPTLAEALNNLFLSMDA